MLITNFETNEQGAFLTWIEVYDLLAYGILELPKSSENFKWQVEAVMIKHNIERDSLDGIRFVFATIGFEYLGLSINDTDKVYEKLMSLVDIKLGNRSIENLDRCLSLDFLRLAVDWRFVDCKQIKGSTPSISTPQISP